MIGAKEVIKYECEHLIHRTSPPHPQVKTSGEGRGEGDGREAEQIMRLPSKWNGEQHLMYQGRQTAEAWAWPGDTVADSSHIRPRGP